jgi:hypothetical protein
VTGAIVWRLLAILVAAFGKFAFVGIAVFRLIGMRNVTLLRRLGTGGSTGGEPTLLRTCNFSSIRSGIAALEGIFLVLIRDRRAVLARVAAGVMPVLSMHLSVGKRHVDLLRVG